MLRGNVTATMDEKGRLKLPAAFRAEIDENWGSKFYVTSLTGESARVYPFPVWQEIEDRLAKIPAMNPAIKKFLDRTNYYGQETAADKNGRILIPALLRESARMTGEVAVLGYLNYLEVWNHDRFRANLDEQPFTREDYQVLSGLGV